MIQKVNIGKYMKSCKNTIDFTIKMGNFDTNIRIIQF